MNPAKNILLSRLLPLGCFLAGIALSAAGTILAFSLSTKYPHCDHKIMREFPAPNGNRVGFVMRTNCGATTPFVTSVRIRIDEEDFDFDRDVLFSIRGENNIELVWRNSPLLDVMHAEPILTVVYDKPPSIYRQAIVWGTEQISYRERQ